MQLTIWNLSSDSYSYQQLADNFIKIDQHDHGVIGKKINASVGILDGSITASKLAADSVTSNAIRSGAVDTDEINNLAVTGAKIANKAVGTGQIADNAVTSDQIKNGSVTPEKLSKGFVPEVVTTLPRVSSIADGYEVYYVADAANKGESIWHLKYSKTYARWLYLGGAPVQGVQPQNNYSGSSTDLIPQGRAIDGQWRAVASVALPLKGKYLITISGHGNIEWAAPKNATIANAQFQMGYYATSNTTWSATPKTKTAALIPTAQKTYYEAPITKTVTDLAMPVTHTGYFDNSSTSISSLTPLRLFARRTDQTNGYESNASQNTIGGTMSKGVITAIPIYIKAV
jgi:hypothetical protein